jgi:hypothetical protein
MSSRIQLTSLFLDTGLELAEDLLDAMKHIRLDWHNQQLIRESGRLLREEGDFIRIHNLMSELKNHAFEMEFCLGHERRHRVVMNNRIPRRPKRTRHQFKIHINNKSHGVILHTQMRIDEPWQDIIQKIYRSFASDDLYTISGNNIPARFTNGFSDKHTSYISRTDSVFESKCAHFSPNGALVRVHNHSMCSSWFESLCS